MTMPNKNLARWHTLSIDCLITANNSFTRTKWPLKYCILRMISRGIFSHFFTMVSKWDLVALGRPPPLSCDCELGQLSKRTSRVHLLYSSTTRTSVFFADTHVSCGFLGLVTQRQTTFWKTEWSHSDRLGCGWWLEGRLELVNCWASWVASQQ